MRKYEELIQAILKSNEDFKKTFKEILDSLDMNIKDFHEISGISQSTLYKITSGRRAPQISTLRCIIKTIRKIENIEENGNIVAIIAARSALDVLKGRVFEIDGRTIRLREYPSTTVEECIISAVQAERDGASAIICAPIVSATVEKIVNLPVATIVPKEESVVKAIRIVASKM